MPPIIRAMEVAFCNIVPFVTGSSNILSHLTLSTAPTTKTKKGLVAASVATRETGPLFVATVTRYVARWARKNSQAISTAKLRGSLKL